MAELFPSVWYATPDRAGSLTKLVVFDDAGSLEVSPRGSAFSGRNGRIDLGGISSVSLSRQRLPWVTYALVNAVTLPALALPVGVLLGMRPDLAGGWWLALVASLVGLMVAANALGVLVGISTRWVVVDYTDEYGQVWRAYFADASGLGWGGIFGGTRRVYRALACSNGRGSPTGE
jgi:hypothetical protein